MNVSNALGGEYITEDKLYSSALAAQQTKTLTEFKPHLCFFNGNQIKQMKTDDDTFLIKCHDSDSHTKRA